MEVIPPPTSALVPLDLEHVEFADQVAKMIAPSRGITANPRSAARAPSGGRCLNISPLACLCLKGAEALAMPGRRRDAPASMDVGAKGLFVPEHRSPDADDEITRLRHNTEPTRYLYWRERSLAGDDWAEAASRAPPTTRDTVMITGPSPSSIL
jgi:hypothetical protein